MSKLLAILYDEASNEFARPISATALQAKQLLSKKCRSGGEPLANTVIDLNRLRLEPQTSFSINERVTARPTGR